MSTIEPDVTQLKALTHPLRLRLLGQLRVRGSSTASQLADDLGESSGATSYHLRQLARHGFVEDDSDRGNGRERWWKATANLTHVDNADTAPEAREASAAFSQAVAATYSHTLQQAAIAETSLNEDWLPTSTLNDVVVAVTAEQALVLRDRIAATLNAFTDEFPGPTEGDDESRPYMIQMHGFPLPEDRHHG